MFTRRLAVRGATRSAAGIATRSFPELTNTVVRAEPLHSATDPGTKFDPVIVSQVLPPGETTLAGNNAEMEGTGFGAEDGGRTKEPLALTANIPERCPITDGQFAKRTTATMNEVRLTFGVNSLRGIFLAVELHNLVGGPILIGRELP